MIVPDATGRDGNGGRAVPELRGGVKVGMGCELEDEVEEGSNVERITVPAVFPRGSVEKLTATVSPILGSTKVASCACPTAASRTIGKRTDVHIMISISSTF